MSDQPLHDPSQLDRASIPAKELEYRAWNARTRDAIMLEQPDMIRYHTGYQLQKRDEDGKWISATASDDNAHAEDEGHPA